jgi:hypothetical protein
VIAYSQPPPTAPSRQLSLPVRLLRAMTQQRSRECGMENTEASGDVCYFWGGSHIALTFLRVCDGGLLETALAAPS